jgi:hypothetical protein
MTGKERTRTCLELRIYSHRLCTGGIVELEFSAVARPCAPVRRILAFKFAMWVGFLGRGLTSKYRQHTGRGKELGKGEMNVTVATNNKKW